MDELQSQQIGVLYLFMTEADRVQYQFMAQGLSREISTRAFSGAIGSNRQDFREGFPNQAADTGRPAHVIQHAAKEAPRQRPSLRDVVHTIASVEPFRSLRVLRGLWYNTRYWKRRKQEAFDFVRINKISVVITMSDVNSYMQAPLAGIKKAGCRVITARTAWIHPMHSAESGASNSVMHRQRSVMPGANMDKPQSLVEWAINKFIGWKLPANVAPTVWGRLLPQQSTDIMALALAGCMPKQLWHIGTDWSDAIIVSGTDEDRALDRYGVTGIERLAIGSVVFQQIHEQLKRRDDLRQEVCASLGIDPSKPIILVGSLATWEHLAATYEEQFDHLEKLFSVLKPFDAQIVVTLHPLSRKEDYKALADRHGLTFLDRSLFSAITFADAYVVPDPTSTVRWAVAAGIPTNGVDFNPGNQVRDLPPGFPLQTSFDALEIWLKDLLPTLPVASALLLAAIDLPMGLIRDGRFFEKLSQAVLPRPSTAPGNTSREVRPSFHLPSSI